MLASPLPPPYPGTTGTSNGRANMAKPQQQNNNNNNNNSNNKNKKSKNKNGNHNQNKNSAPLHNNSNNRNPKSAPKKKKQQQQRHPKHYASSSWVAPPPPWCRSRSPCPSSPPYLCNEAGLQQEVLDLFHFIQLHPSERANRDAWIQTIKEIIQAWGRADLTPTAVAPPLDEEGSGMRVVLHGSYALGLSLPSSDIDLAIVLPSPSPAVPSSEYLTRLYQFIQQHHASLYAEVRRDCRVPVLYLYSEDLDLSCDVIIDYEEEDGGDEMAAPRSRVEKVVERQRRWLYPSPSAPYTAALVLILCTKAILFQWGLHSSFSGGISSTAVYSLVRRFLDGERSSREHTVVALSPESLRQHSRRNEGIVQDAEAEKGKALFRPLSSQTNGCSSQSITCSEDGEERASDHSGGGSNNSPLSSPSLPPIPTTIVINGSSTPTPRRRQGSSGVSSSSERPSSIDYGRLLLNFWFYLSSFSFVQGYGIEDAFAVDEGSGGKKDLTGTAYRVGEVLLLFQQTVQNVERALNPSSSSSSSWRSAPPPPPPSGSLLSTVFVDPRTLDA